ncbi:MAG: HEAT repeat domain-containing protein [Candidatus Lokiarchaeota archaeon]|nr:HEAT repeat domain-containing protein [Candidatus Lokiarchaeota archaeon]
MSKDLKDIINTVEKESKSNTELEQKIQSLKEEINRQNFTIKEQKLLIENLRSQMKNEEIEKAELPNEIDVLKDIITSQRQELDKKDTTIEKLDDKILELTSGSKGDINFNSQNIKSEEFIEAQKTIVKLTTENEEYKNQIELLQTQMEDKQSKTSETMDFVEADINTKVNEELINFKRLNFQLMEENGLLRVEVESLKAKLQERIKKPDSEELRQTNEKISDLTAELEGYEAQVQYLQGQIEKNNEVVIVSTEDALEFVKLREEFDNMKTELVKYQKENQNLRQILNNIEEKKIGLEKRTDLELPKVKGLTKHMQQSLFFRMFNLLDDFSKEKVINYLIQDLGSGKYQVKRNAIKILSVLKNKKIYNAFLEMLNDKDWIVRYSIIKALSKFEDKNDELKMIFQRFSSDVDVDVRELALKILNDFPK